MNDTSNNSPSKPPRTVVDLREALFLTIDAVRAGTLDLDRARVVSDLSQVLVNAAKVEVDYLRVTGNDASTGFLAQPEPAPTPPALPRAEPLPNGVTGIVRHVLKG